MTQLHIASSARCSFHCQAAGASLRVARRRRLARRRRGRRRDARDRDDRARGFVCGYILLVVPFVTRGAPSASASGRADAAA